MKQINVYFDDEEWVKIRKIKRKLRLSWHDMIMKFIEERIRK